MQRAVACGLSVLTVECINAGLLCVFHESVLFQTKSIIKSKQN